MYDYSSFLPIENTFCIIVGNSGSGKSSFCKILCDYMVSEKKIYIFSKHCADFQLRTKPIVALREISFNKEWIQNNIESNSVLICDDFVLDKSEIDNFRQIVNYYCRHQHLTLIIIIHSLFKTKIFSDINSASHFFY